MKIMNTLKKFGSKVVNAGKAVQNKALGLMAVGGAILAGATPAKADLATELAKVATAATDGVDTVSTSVSSVYVAVFGLVLLGVGIAWLFGAIKKR